MTIFDDGTVLHQRLDLLFAEMVCREDLTAVRTKLWRRGLQRPWRAGKLNWRPGTTIPIEASIHRTMLRMRVRHNLSDVVYRSCRDVFGKKACT